MQTFLPLESFEQTASILDMRRLGKQRVEVLQILNALEGHTGWSRHPAVLMWRGHEWWLLLYGITVCEEWRARGYRDTLLPRFLDMIESRRVDPYPPWLGLRCLHASHMGNLVRKDPKHYGSLWPSVEPMMGYHWPV